MTEYPKQGPGTMFDCHSTDQCLQILTDMFLIGNIYFDILSDYSECIYFRILLEWNCEKTNILHL
jgi:hypothetical protein